MNITSLSNNLLLWTICQYFKRRGVVEDFGRIFCIHFQHVNNQRFIYSKLSLVAWKAAHSRRTKSSLSPSKAISLIFLLLLRSLGKETSVAVFFWSWMARCPCKSIMSKWPYWLPERFSVCGSNLWLCFCTFKLLFVHRGNGPAIQWAPKCHHRSNQRHHMSDTHQERLRQGCSLLLALHASPNLCTLHNYVSIWETLWNICCNKPRPVGGSNNRVVWWISLGK